MTSFVNPHSSVKYDGAGRAESAAYDFPPARGVALLLLSAMTAAVAAVAYEVMDSTGEAHLLVIWMALWAVMFAVLALVMGMARRIRASVKGRLDAWSHRLAQTRADQRLWAMAQQDERVMTDLKMAMARHEATAAASSATAMPAPAARAARALKSGDAVLSGHHRYSL